MKRFLAVLIVLALIGAAVAGWKYYSDNTGTMSVFTSKPAQVKDIVSTVTATGTLAAVTEVNVGSEVSGTIAKLYVDYNDEVKKGQLLAQIDPKTLQTQVDKAEANLLKSQSTYENQLAAANKAQADLSRLRANVLTSESKVKQAMASLENSKASVISAEANVRKAQAEFDKNKIDFERTQKLRAQDLIAQSDLDDARASYLSSQASLDASKASLSGAQASRDSAALNLEGVRADLEASRLQVTAGEQTLISAQASVKGAKADVQQAQANLESAQVDLKKTAICSPSDGVVIDVSVSEGQTVAAQYQAPQLFTLAYKLDEMQVEANVDEADIGQVTAGSKVTFTVDAWPDREFKGQVMEVRKSATTTNNVVTYPVIISADNSDLCLMPGMTATVAITVSEKDGALSVPNSALRFKPTTEKGAEKFAAKDEDKGEDDAKGADGEANGSAGSAEKKTEQSIQAAAADAHYKTIYVLKFNKDSGKRTPPELEARQVITGITDGTDTEIVSGDLKEGERVVTGSTEVDKAKAAKRNNRHHGPGPF